MTLPENFHAVVSAFEGAGRDRFALLTVVALLARSSRISFAKMKALIGMQHVHMLGTCLEGMEPSKSEQAMRVQVEVAWMMWQNAMLPAVSLLCCKLRASPARTGWWKATLNHEQSYELLRPRCILSILSSRAVQHVDPFFASLTPIVMLPSPSTLRSIASPRRTKLCRPCQGAHGIMIPNQLKKASRAPKLSAHHVRPLKKPRHQRKLLHLPGPQLLLWFLLPAWRSGCIFVM